MTMPWFRMFNEARNDAKLRSLTDAEFRVWFNLLCLASEQDERGVIRNAIPFLLAIETCNASVTLCNETLHRLCALRFIETSWYHADTAIDGDEDTVTIRFLNWEKYQAGKPSDAPERVAERVKAHRERTKDAGNADVTPRNALQQSGNAIDKEEDRELTPPTPSPGEPAGKPPRVVRGSRIPDDFATTPELYAYAAEKGVTAVEADSVTEGFVLYWQSASGKTATKIDWNKAWMNRVLDLLEAGKIGPTRRNGSMKPNGYQSQAEINQLKRNPDGTPKWVG
jgi:hypothetical protein